MSGAKFFVLLLFFPIIANGQETEPKFNLDFENTFLNKALPDNWFAWGDYKLSKDSTIVYSGKNSGKINGAKGGSFGSIAYKIPSRYKGKIITLEGYMKIKNVADGHAGLLMRLDGKSGILQFENMQQEGINGTTDWKKYTISLPFDNETEQIYIAGILVGNGTAWFDGFRVTIDGKDVQTLKEIEKKKTKGELDNEFISGSDLVVDALSNEQLKNLELLGRVWGVLKYHHPAIAEGAYNWDFELFRIMPAFLNTKNTSDRDKILIDWITSYGEIAKCKSCKPAKVDAYLKPDHSWLSEYNISKELSKTLSFVIENRHQGNHYYIDFNPNAGNPLFTNENDYADMPYPDVGFRILNLFRYWNMIEYYFPYKHLTNTDWNLVLSNYLNQFIEAKNEFDYEIATLQLIGELGDTHANLWGGNNAIQNWKGNFYPPFHVRFIEDRPVVVDYYNPELETISQLAVGDVITKINGQEITTLLKEKASFYPASNIPTQLRDIGEELLRSTDSTISITYEHKGNIKNHLLKLYPKNQLNTYRWYKRNPDGTSYKWLDDNIGYITLQNIKEEDINPIKKEFIDADGIVIDIRNYPSYFVPFALGQYFINEITPFARFTEANPKNPGEFLLNSGVKIPPKGKQFKGKLVVLVNELSQSQAEYTAMAFRATPNCTIIGSTTAGADGNVSRIALPGGMSTSISGIGVHYPDGSETQRIGIVPDIEVKPTITGVTEGQDELLQKAIELIKTN